MSALRNPFPTIACLICVLVLFYTGFAGPAHAEPDTKPISTSHVYVFTGFGGFRKSYVDGVADRVRQRGLPTTVSTPGDASAVATSAIEDYRRGRVRSVVIVGYSMGGGAAIKMAADLAQANVPVQLVLTIDPVSVPEVPGNIRRLINYYVPNGISGPIEPPKTFRGILKNVGEPNRDLGHFSIARTREDELIKIVISAAAHAAAPAPAVQMTKTAQPQER
jgi:pimeloyl-ACP methyl ester carboxylesterase